MPQDDERHARILAKKTAELRVFPDERDRMDRSVRDIGGGVLAVSQFTLCANTGHGRRPDFSGAARPEIARPLFDTVLDELRQQGIGDVQSGRFLEDRFAPVPLSIFRDERFLMQRKGQDMHSRSLALCRASGFEPQSYLHLNQLVTALDLTRQNRGLTFVSDTGAKTLTSGEGLIFYKLGGELTRRKVYISYRKNRYVSRAMRKFIQLTAGHMTPATGP